MSKAAWSLLFVLVGFMPGSVAIRGQAPATPHPSVRFAAQLLKDGQVDEAISTLRPRLDADPEDCQALGLMFVAHLQQHDASRLRPWRERLRAIPRCAATAEAAIKLESASAERAALATSIAGLVVQGDAKKIDDVVTEAERSRGPLPVIRSYVDLLNGRQPELRSDVPDIVQTAIQKRRAETDAAGLNAFGSHIAGYGLTFRYPEKLPPFWQQALASDGYRLGLPLATTRGPQGIQGHQKWIEWHAKQVQHEYNLAPLSEGALTDVMTLAFMSGDRQQIEAVAALMASACHKIVWLGTYRGPDGKDWWLQDVWIEIDLGAKTLSQRPFISHGSIAKAPKEVVAKWTLNFADVKEISQPGIKFGVLKETGQRGMGPAEQGALINGSVRLPLPAHMHAVGIAYSEIPVRQALREYVLQIARLVGLPADKVSMVGERPGRGLFNLMQIWSAASNVAMEATGKSIMPSQWVDFAAYLSQQNAAVQAKSAQAMDVWEQARRDPVLGQALVENFTLEIDQILQIVVK